MNLAGVEKVGAIMGSIARRSVNGWTVTGSSGQSSRILFADFGDGAANEVARILAAFDRSGAKATAPGKTTSSRRQAKRAAILMSRMGAERR